MPDRWEPKGDAWDMAANNKFRFIAAGTAKCDAISPLEFEHYRLKSNISSRSTERTIIRTPTGNNELGANGRAIAMSRSFQAQAQMDDIIQFLAGDARKIIALGSGLRIRLRLTNANPSGVLLTVIESGVTTIM